MPEEKKKSGQGQECEACQVLGDYMCPGTPGDGTAGTGKQLEPTVKKTL